MNVLYLINYAGKAGTEKYVENLVRILGKDKITPFFAYNIAGELSEKMKAAGVPSIKLDMGKTAMLSAAKTLADFCRENLRLGGSAAGGGAEGEHHRRGDGYGGAKVGVLRSGAGSPGGRRNLLYRCYGKRRIF